MSSDTTPSKSYPELLAWLAAKVDSILIARGVDAGVTAGVGLECAEHLRREWGGDKLYVPKAKSHDKEVRDKEIVSRWNGRNTRELAIEYGVAVNTIRRAYKDAKTKRQ